MDGNLNCPLPVTRAATLFAIRALTDPDAPASAGAFRPVSIAAPLGSVLNARPGAAVVAGNVETSSRVADLVFAALAEVADGPAQGQGTMNNLTLSGRSDHGGSDEFTYYETIGGGQGACRDAPGPSAVHVAMSNTLNTPVEALEAELPVRIRELAIRRGSGGAGAEPGGDGIVPRDRGAGAAALLADHRASLGGSARARRAAATARRAATRSTASRCRRSARATSSRATCSRIETPGGGGFGTGAAERPGRG